MTGLAAAHERRRSDSTLKRARVSQTIQLAVARGDVPTISKIAREAGVDRSIFYGERGTPLRAELDLAIARIRSDLDRSVTAAGRVTAATLRADLATANELNRRLRQQLAALEHQLSQRMGQDILDEMPSLRRTAMLADQELQARNGQLTARVSDLERQIRELEDALDGARRAIRDLTRQINGTLKPPRSLPSPT